MQDKVDELQCEIKKVFILKEKPKNEPKNYDDEQIKCYTYFMVQIQVREEEDWGQMEPKRGDETPKRSYNFRTQSAEKSNPKGLQFMLKGG